MSKISTALHKVFGTKQGEGMQPKEALSYSIAGLGQNLICGLVGTYITVYFLEGLLINPLTVGFIMLGIRIFDALNDPIMGTIVDFTNTKAGKCRPYLAWMPVPIAIFTMLVFLPYEPISTTTTILVTVFYTLWSVLYTVVDVPYWGLATSMTNQTHQRGTILTVARIFCTLGAGIVTIVVPTLIGAWQADFIVDKVVVDTDGAALALRQNFWWVALIFIVVAMPTFFIGYANTRERYFDDKDKRTLPENLGLLFKNKPLGWIALSGILGGAKTLFIYCGVFFAMYNLTALGTNILGMQGAALNTIITFSVIPGGLIASVLVPWCTKKFGKRNTYIYTHLIGGIAMIGAYFAGWQSNLGLAIGLLALVISGFPQGAGNIVTYAMIADTVDYLEDKTGKRAEGICYAIQTFMNKIGIAVGGAVAAFGLYWAHIDPKDAFTKTIEGNSSGLDLLFALMILLPGISMLLSAVPLFFYKFNEKEQAEAVARVMARRGIDADGNKLETTTTPSEV